MTKTYGHLVPSVERRLSAWVSLSDHRASGEAPPRRPTITVSRRFGCEGFPLAEQLKALLDAATGEPWNIYDKSLLERVAADEHLSLELLKDLGGPSHAADALGFLVAGYKSQSEAFRHIVKHVLRVAEGGNAIIVGRGAAIITQHLANCYHFRLDASFSHRVSSIASRMELTEKDAEKFVRENERVRERFIEECLGKSMSDFDFYDAVFNSGRHAVADIARSIVAYVAEDWREHGYFKERSVA
jgi:cytidylate kinase